MKLFVTGSTGFVGSNFIKQAILLGHEVVAIKRKGSEPRVPLIEEPFWIEGFMDEDYPDTFSGIDVFVHLASHTPNPPYDNLSECLYTNVFASIRLAEQAVMQGVKKFIIVGTCFEYGESASKFDCLNVDSSLEPNLSYPTSKAAASIAFEGFAREHKIKLKILRLFQVYGDGESERRMWPSLKKAALSGNDFPMSEGKQIRDFISIGSVVAQIVEQLNFDNTLPGMPQRYHLTENNQMTVLEFASFWWKKWGAKGKLLPGVIPNRVSDFDKVISCKEK
jgi:nucleoside-diphosphate-sugar epimerase